MKLKSIFAFILVLALALVPIAASQTVQVKPAQGLTFDASNLVKTFAVSNSGAFSHAVTYTPSAPASGITVTVAASTDGTTFGTVASSSNAADTLTFTGTYREIKITFTGITGTIKEEAVYTGVPAVSSSGALFREAANTYGLRNGTNPQEFRVYNTYTSPVVYDVLRMYASSNTFRLLADVGASGGTARDFYIGTMAGSDLYLLSNGALQWKLDDVTGNLTPVTNNATSFGDTSHNATNVFSYTFTSKGVAFASLPTGVAGMTAYVTDSNTVTWGATVAGGGANKVLAFYNGTNWTVAGK